MMRVLAGMLIPTAAAALGLVLLVGWARSGPSLPMLARVPGMDRVPPPKPVKPPQRPVAGQPKLGDGRPSRLPGAWPWFRGLRHDAVGGDEVRLARAWPPGGPPRLWTVTLGDGFAAAAVSEGRVFVLDHLGDADVMRCFSLDDGREIWRNSYPVVVPPHHGQSRTIPAVLGDAVVSLGPQCQVACWDAAGGQARWLIDLVLDHGATVPPWYAGQCPLLDATEGDRSMFSDTPKRLSPSRSAEKWTSPPPAEGRAILAPGGTALVMAVDIRSGKVVWQSGNPHRWTMTHASIVPMEFAGRRMYVYCGKGGVAGVSATDGSILWETTDWQISVATCPSPVVLPAGRIFFSGGYNAGSLFLQLQEEGGRLTAKTTRRLSAREFGSEQQTPVLFDGHLYGVRQRDQQLVCLDLEGKELWNSGRDKFGSAPYMIAGGAIYALNDEGLLTMAEASPRGYRPLARAQVIPDGVTCWGPMALVGGRLIVRDLNRLVCVDISERSN
jgi:outer membrane protein assembly factor BamB